MCWEMATKSSMLRTAVLLAAAATCHTGAALAGVSGSCSVVHRGSRPGTLLLRGTALTYDGVVPDAQILIVNGTIASVTASLHQGWELGLPHHDHYHHHQDDIANHPTRPQLGPGLEDATIVHCPDSHVISPGFINTHEHIEFSTVRPLQDIGERADHRHDWRVGLRGHTVRPAPVNTTAGTEEDAVIWGELRHLLSGTTSIVGGKMAPGLVRNLDFQDGLEEPLLSILRKQAETSSTDVATWDVFPLDDALGVIREGDCNYGPNMVDGSAVRKMHRYLPHVAEGVDEAARNEFKCLSDPTFDTTPIPRDSAPLAAPEISAFLPDGDKSHSALQHEKEKHHGVIPPLNIPSDPEKISSPHAKRPITPRPGTSTDILGPNIGLVHGLGIPESAYPVLANRGASIVWSPRSNVFLYGETLNIHALLAAGVNVALGTDWLPSGSATMVREAVCAWDVARNTSSFSSTSSYSNPDAENFTAKQLWEMMTINAAQVAGVSDKLGVIQVGAVADIIIYHATKSDTRSDPPSRRGKNHGSIVDDDDHDDHDHDHFYAGAVFAEPADIQLVLRGGKPMVVDASIKDMLHQQQQDHHHSGCEQVSYGDAENSKYVCIAEQREASDGDDEDNVDGKENLPSYSDLIHKRLAQGVYPALFPRGVPDDEPSCVPTR